MTTALDMVEAVRKRNYAPRLEAFVLDYLLRHNYTRPDARMMAIELHRYTDGYVPPIRVDCFTCAPPGSADWDPRAGDWCYDFAVSIIEDIP